MKYFKFILTFLLCTQVFTACKKADMLKPTLCPKTNHSIIIDGKQYISATFGAKFQSTDSLTQLGNLSCALQSARIAEHEDSDDTGKAPFDTQAVPDDTQACPFRRREASFAIDAGLIDTLKIPYETHEGRTAKHDASIDKHEASDDKAQPVIEAGEAPSARHEPVIETASASSAKHEASIT